MPVSVSYTHLDVYKRQSVSLPTKNTIITLPPQAIRAFRGHPFRLYEGDRLNDLVESISEHGVLNPAIVRKIERDEDGFEYEMLAGHNRQNAAAIANREPVSYTHLDVYKRQGYAIHKPLAPHFRGGEYYGVHSFDSYHCVIHHCRNKKVTAHPAR